MQGYSLLLTNSCIRRVPAFEDNANLVVAVFCGYSFAVWGDP